MMDAVIAEAGISKTSISHCAFANGPGAFTGIRIAAAQAQGIGIALGIPLITVSSLAVLAQRCLDLFDGKNAMVALDARMGEIYWANYSRDSNGIAQLHGEERLSSADDIPFIEPFDCAAGHGWACAGMSEHIDPGLSLDTELLPDAASLLKLARVACSQNQLVSASDVSINYLRNKVAEKANPRA